jgi:hypothetical protein
MRARFEPALGETILLLLDLGQHAGFRGKHDQCRRRSSCQRPGRKPLRSRIARRLGTPSVKTMFGRAVPRLDQRELLYS